MTFSLPDFLPYLLNQAAEKVGRDFQNIYRDRYGMLRTEWRVLFHLGCYGDMTAKQICDAASIHKTKVSRAVRALEVKRFVRRETDASDRRHEVLSLTKAGVRAFDDLSAIAAEYEARIVGDWPEEEVAQLRGSLERLLRSDV